MGITNWGELTKAVDNPETIEEAIERLIDVHDQNEDAHLGDNGSLLSHKASEIIDHLADSVITDKILDENISNLKINARARAYTAIVDNLGTGDFTTIQPAIDYVHSLGGGSILILPATYTLSADLILYDNIALYGLKNTDCILDFSNSGFCIKIVPPNGIVKYDTGTVSVAFNSYRVDGVGTTWLSNVSVGQGILINGTLFFIASVINNTQLTLTTPYRGHVFTGMSYRIRWYIKNVILNNFTVKKGGQASTAYPAVYCVGLYSSEISQCSFIANQSQGINFADCYSCDVYNNDGMYNGFGLIHLNSMTTRCTIRNNRSNNNYYYGIYNSSEIGGNSILNNSCCFNYYGGIGGNAQKADIISGNICSNNDYGIEMMVGNGSIISDNICCDNLYDGLYCGGGNSLGNLIKGNTCFGNGRDGIRIKYMRNSVCENYCKNNIGSGISIFGDVNNINTDYNVLSNNICSLNTGYGINNNYSSNEKNIITSNQLTGNIAGSLNDVGTGTVLANNVLA